MLLGGVWERRAIRPGLIALAGLALAAGAFGNAVGNMLALRNPRGALRFDSANATALAGAATLALAERAADGQRGSDGAALAASALRGGPIAAGSMRAVAIATSLEGDAGRSLRQLEIAQAMSRRDLPTQMALIETCVARGNIACALTHYDIALTNSVSNAAPLFPVLSGALTDPTIVRAVAPYIRKGRPWGAGFMTYVAQQADAAAAAALVVATGRLPEGAANRESEGVLFGRLAAAGRWDLVQRMYRAVEGPRAASSPLAGFTRRQIDPSRIPVAWQPISSGSVATSFEPAGGDAFALRLDVAGGGTGDVEAARRLMFLSQGRYAAIVRLGEGGARGVGLALSLRCLVPGDTTAHEAAAWRLAGSTAGDHVWHFAVPFGCPAQALSVSATGAADRSDGTIMVQRIALAPEPAARKEGQDHALVH